jgi:hypothetical protein
MNDRQRPKLGWLSAVAAFLLLNVSLSFENVWPTPAIRWRGLLSLEFVICLLVLFVVRRTRARLRWLSAGWLLLVLGRYADVTAPALYGRDINLYWDARFMPDVAAMVTRVAPFWLILAVIIGSVLALTGVYLVIRWAFGRVADTLDDRRGRPIVASLVVAAITWFTIQQVGTHIPERPGFARMVTPTYARQVRLAVEAFTTRVEIGPSPPMDADLSLAAGADVLLIFIESYGAISFDRPSFEQPLASSRIELERAVRDTNREIVSAFVESTTFGGSSWLAHISLMSGVEIRDHEANAALMRQQRNTMGTLFKRRGYRTIALMPGLKLPWPEGSFYGFDQTYNAERLEYPGPDFGWFAVPDQFSLAWIDQAELGVRGRAPVFLFFPTLSTHFPFSPTPPYQDDWPRLLTDSKFSAQQIVDAYSEDLDWVDFGPAYVKAMSYSYATIGGYLRLRADRDFIMILAGDHQPPAAVSGEGASWDVPVHVITSRRPIIDHLNAHGFARGLLPPRRALTRIDKLLPVLLDAFSGKRPGVATDQP